MKRRLILFLFIIVFQATDAQLVTVTDHQSGNPIEGVVIRSDGRSVQTDNAGQASLSIFMDMEVLHFHHPSYEILRTDKRRIMLRAFHVQLVEKPLRLDEIVISASRRTEKRDEIPNQVVLISHLKALDYQPQTMADLLSAGGGVYVQKSQQGGGSPMVRGFSANRLLIVVDGVRMNNALFRSGNLQNVVSLDPNMTEFSEVISGPGTVIHGSDAVGGVLSFQTFRPKLSSGIHPINNFFLKSGYATANQHHTLHGKYGYGSRKWGFLISGTYSGFGNLIMGKYGPDEYLRKEFVRPGFYMGTDSVSPNKNPRVQRYSGYHQVNLMSKLRFMPGDKTDINFGIHYSATGNVPRYDRLTAKRKGQLRYGDWYYGPQKWLLLSGQLDWVHNAFLFDKMSLIAAFQLFNESRHDRNLNSEWLYHRGEELDAGSLTLDFTKDIVRFGVISYGIELTKNVVGSFGEAENLLDKSIRSVNTRYPDGAQYHSFAAYVAGRKKIHNALLMNAGARITGTSIKGEIDKDFYPFPSDGFDIQKGTLTGNMGLVWNPGPKWLVNVLLSTGFRSPNIDDIAKVFDSEPGNVVVPNPGLKPEYIFNREIRISRSFSNQGKIEINLFNARLDKAMVRRPFTINGQDSLIYNGIPSRVEAIVNADYALVSGATLSLVVPLANGFLLENNISCMRGKDSEGFSLRHVPPLFGTTRLFFEAGNWSSGLSFHFNGKVPHSRLAPEERNKPDLYIPDGNGNPYSPGWSTLNFMTAWSPQKNIKINSAIENILNKRYMPYSSGIAAPGRNLTVSLSLSF